MITSNQLSFVKSDDSNKVTIQCMQCQTKYRNNNTYCCMCNAQIHLKCTKNGAITVRGELYCEICVNIHDPKKYNTFYETLESITSGSGCSHFDDEPKESLDMLESLSSTLESCKAYSIHEFNKYISQPKTQITTNSKAISCHFLNIDGNATNFDSFVTTLASMDYKFDLIGIAETNISAECKNLYDLDGYESIYQDKIFNKKKGSGVALYISSNLVFTKMNEQSYVNGGIESLFVKIVHPKSVFIAGVIYRPPGGDVKKFNESISSIMSSFNDSDKVYILGDFNINLFERNAHVKTFEETYMCNGFSPIISCSTHNKPHCKNSCIDNIFVRNITIANNGTIKTDISHHKSLFSVSETEQTGPTKTESNCFKVYYCYSKENLEKLSSYLLSNLEQTNPTNISELAEIIQRSIDEACKLRNPKSSKRNSQNNPWISKGLINSIAKRDRLYFKWKKTVSKNCKSGNSQLYEIYRKYRNMLSNLIKKAKSKYYHAKFTSASGDKKKMWKLINSLRGIKKQSLSSTFKIDNVNISCRKRIANAFNKHFSSLAKNLNKDIDLSNESIPNFCTYLPKHQQNSLFLDDTSSEEIIDIIKEFKDGKLSDIPVIVIKHIKEIIAPYMSKFINACISTGTFPSSLKLGKITRIHKKGPKNEVSNYRPVSTLPIFGKIFEKIIYSRLYSFLTDHNVLSNTQFGFRKHHSTSYAVNHSVNLIKQFQWEGKNTIGVFIDLIKAFDTIDHTTLLSKLECYGIRGIAHDLLRSYLSNRYQLINIDGTNSNKELVSYGVPKAAF